MGQVDKLHQRVVNSQTNVSFADLQRLVNAFGYQLDRVKGSHHIFRHPETGSKLNLQPHGKTAKPYQVREFLRQVERYNLKLREP